jgi:hypothetical protein
LHAYFGARIDLAKQGYHKGDLWCYDIASAYPATATDLPSLKGGRWEHKENPSREEIEQSCCLSMFRVHTMGYGHDLPFYPLPDRTPSGSILFPANVHGIYMRDHVIALCKHYDKFKNDIRIINVMTYKNMKPKIVVLEAWIFYPATDEKPLAWIRGLFDYRASLPKGDSRGQVIKLGINAIYGKFAQRVGRRGQAPKWASLWYAAAITAGTQRKLIEAALTDPDNAIAFATDGLYSMKALNINIPAVKTLGEWEMKQGIEAAFIQSGVNFIVTMDRKKGTTKTEVKSRGFSPKNLEKKDGETYQDVLVRTMRDDVRDYWSESKDEYPFKYTQYVTVGMAAQSRGNSDLIGHWKIGLRALDLNSAAAKRVVPDQSMYSALQKIDAIKQKKAEGTKLTKKELELWEDRKIYSMPRESMNLRKARSNELVSLKVMHLYIAEYAHANGVIPEIPLSAQSNMEWLSEANKIARKTDEEQANVVAGLT